MCAVKVDREPLCPHARKHGESEQEHKGDNAEEPGRESQKCKQQHSKYYASLGHHELLFLS